MTLLALFALIGGLALAPALIYILIIWWLDRYEKEPLGLAALAFVWGATPAVILALIFEIVLGIPFAGTGLVGDFSQGAVVAPIVEEGTKGIILLVLFLAYRHEFDDVLDGILYGALVGLGFSVVENVVYGFRFAFPDGYQPGLTPDLNAVFAGWFLRSGLFGLNHAFFTSITGATLGYLRSNPGVRSRWGLPLLGLAGAIGFHSLHNTLVSVGEFVGDDAALLGCGISLFTDWAGISVLLVVALIAGTRERRWIEAHLREEVAVGRFSPGEYQMLISARRRWLARMDTLTRNGWGAFRRLGRLQQLATELAFRKQQVLTDPASPWKGHDIQVLRARIDDLHRHMAGPARAA